MRLERTRPSATLAGLGTCLPSRVVTNAELTRSFDTSDDWIVTRTGIRERRVTSPGTTVVDLAEAAARNALASAGADVQALVLATTTPYRPCPAMAPEVAARLGLTGAAAYDISAVCSGAVYGIANAVGLITAGVADAVLVVCAETYSSILDPEDRSTGVIFGDGAGAFVLRQGEADEPGAILAIDLGSDGRHADLIARAAPDGRFRMAGTAVYRMASRTFADTARQVMKGTGWAVEDVDAFVPHQANRRITDAVVRELGLAPAAAVGNIDRVGNTSAASIPLALADGVREGRPAPGHRTLLAAMGGGLTWGAAALVWPEVEVVSSEL
ncbi:beta-ketoacyl-ACP synthase III [Kitasatospora misakiensis]|uniref:Beta-ketoacyl-[acyl-carrier-protein] synthase III n=1 Tax=Kitasatospora misakiensis TaxID=67330 RepID=A0ABW0X700_9ACTN